MMPKKLSTYRPDYFAGCRALNGRREVSIGLSYADYDKLDTLAKSFAIARGTLAKAVLEAAIRNPDFCRQIIQGKGTA